MMVESSIWKNFIYVNIKTYSLLFSNVFWNLMTAMARDDLIDVAIKATEMESNPVEVLQEKGTLAKIEC